MVPQKKQVVRELKEGRNLWDRVPKRRKSHRKRALEICIGFPLNLLLNTKPQRQRMKYPEDKQKTSGGLRAE